jgi:hypothetical protein
MDDLTQAIEEVCEIVLKMVVPLYVNANDAPQLVGTGILLTHNRSNLLVSAAHVLEELRSRPLYFYSEPAVLRRVTGTLTTNVPASSREHDLVDIGAVRLTGPGQPPYPAVDKSAVQSRILSRDHPVNASSRYCLVGFPESRSRVLRGPKQVLVEPYAYLANSIQLTEYAGLGLDHEVHLCLSFDKKKSFDLHGNGRTFPKPHGISGSPIVRLYDEENLDDDPTSSLAGIVTTWDPKGKRLYGVRTRSIAELVQIAA